MTRLIISGIGLLLCCGGAILAGYLIEPSVPGALPDDPINAERKR